MNLIDKYLGEAEYPLKYIPKKILKDFENTWNKKACASGAVSSIFSISPVNRTKYARYKSIRRYHG